MKTFSCPQCGGSLEAGPITNPTVECPYCHSAVIVPPELRPPPPTPSFRSFEPEPPKPVAFSFPKAISILVASAFVFILLILIIARPGGTARSTYSAPPIKQPTFSPKATPSPYVFTFGGEGTGQGLFQDAQEVAVDGNGNIYVSDETKRIQKFDSNGQFLSLWNVPSTTRNYSKVNGGPDKLLADRSGNVFVVIGGVVLKYDGANGKALGEAQGSEYVYDAALKAEGGMVIVSGNSQNDELVVLDAYGKAIKRVPKFISGQLDKQVPVEALKVAVDGVGNIFGIYALGSVYGEHYYDNEDLAVFRFTPEGKYVNRFSGGGKEPGQFSSPTAIAVDNQSRVYVCDLTEGISIFTADGRYLENLKTPFWVQGMAFDSAGDLLVVSNNKVSKLDLTK